MQVEKLVDHPGIDDGAFHLHLKLGQPSGWIIRHQQGRNKSEKGSRRHSVIDGAKGGIGQNACNREAGKCFRERRRAFGKPCDAIGAVFCGADDPIDLFAQLLFHRESLDDGNALDGFLHGAKDMAVQFHGFARCTTQALGNITQGIKKRWRYRKNDQ